MNAIQRTLVRPACPGVLTLLIVLVVWGAAVSANERPVPVQLIGRWNYVSGESGGQPTPTQRLRDKAVVITAETMTLVGMFGGDYVMEYQLNLAEKPHRISCKLIASPYGSGTRVEGIFDVQQDRLRICYAHEGPVPKAFTSKANVNHRYVVLERIADVRTDDDAPADGQ